MIDLCVSHSKHEFKWMTFGMEKLRKKDISVKVKFFARSKTVLFFSWVKFVTFQAFLFIRTLFLQVSVRIGAYCLSVPNDIDFFWANEIQQELDIISALKCVENYFPYALVPQESQILVESKTQTVFALRWSGHLEFLCGTTDRLALKPKLVDPQGKTTLRKFFLSEPTSFYQCLYN